METEVLPRQPTPEQWAVIERAYRTGFLPVSVLARMHGLRTAEVKDRASKEGWRLDLVHEVRQEVTRRLAVSIVADPDGEAPADIVEQIAKALTDIQSEQRRAVLDMLEDWCASHAAYRRVRSGTPVPGDVLWLGKNGSLATWETHLLEQREKLHAMTEQAFALPMGDAEELPAAGRGAVSSGPPAIIEIYIPDNGRTPKPAVTDGEDAS